MKHDAFIPPGYEIGCGARSDPAAEKMPVLRSRLVPVPFVEEIIVLTIPHIGVRSLAMMIEIVILWHPR